MLDNVFPEFDWTGFGEHVGENELNEDADLVSLAHLGVLPGQALGSPNIASGSLGISGLSRAVLGSSGGVRLYVLGTHSGTRWSSITAGSSDVEDAIGVGSPKSPMRVSGNALWIV